MRNTLLTRAIQWNIDYYDDSHVYSGTVPSYAIGRDTKDLKTQIDTQNTSFQNSLPVGWTIEPQYPNTEFKLYFLLDKEAMMVIAQTFAAQFVSDAYANQPPFFPMLISPKKTPRKTGWTDPAGVKRVAAPSDRGIKPTLSEAGIFDPLFVEFPVQEFLDSLSTLASKLKRAGDLRGAGIVLFARSEVVALRFSVIEALSYLSENDII